MEHLAIPLIILFVVGGLTLLSCLSWSGRPDKNEGVDIEREAIDSDLEGPVTITRQTLYPGSRRGESGHAIARYDTTYSGGRLKVSKWILACDMPYLSNTGHNVLYQYFREDGSLDYDRLVHPEPMLGGGVYVKVRLRYFNAQNEEVQERYLREDGTLGVVVDMTTNGRFQEFRKDGTLRFEQLSLADQGLRHIWYRVDGQTIWMETGVDGSTQVYFDLAGNPIDLKFTREDAIGSYGMGPQSQPLLTSYDKYTGNAGSLAYKQTWYARWDTAAATSVDTLGALAVYDANGTEPVAEYTLELRAASRPRFIKEVVLHNTDETALVRKYRSPGCRLSEDVVDSQKKVIGHTDFADTDHYQEVVDEIAFQGFTRNVWGFYDDTSHDV